MLYETYLKLRSHSSIIPEAEVVIDHLEKNQFGPIIQNIVTAFVLRDLPISSEINVWIEHANQILYEIAGQLQGCTIIPFSLNPQAQPTGRDIVYFHFGQIIFKETLGTVTHSTLVRLADNIPGPSAVPKGWNNLTSFTHEPRLLERHVRIWFCPDLHIGNLIEGNGACFLDGEVNLERVKEMSSRMN